MGERTAWRPFLELWSREWIDGHDPESSPPLAEEVVRDGWLGFAPASEAEVAAAEARLGCRLPPSLREFLLVTNGWRDAGNFIYRLAGTTELEWLRDTDDRHWIEVYQDIAGEDAGEDAGSGGDPDDELGEFDEDEPEPYGVEEARVLARSLRLSLAGDAAVLLLDPGDVDEDGEWAGYWLASWSGVGPERHDSFHDLMRRQWRSFHALRRPPGPTRDHWDAEVERARQAALGGEVDGPLAVFAEAHEFGNRRADVLRMQMNALLGDWQRGLIDILWHRPDEAEILRGPLFAAELLPLLLRQDELAERHALRPLARLQEHAPQPVRDLIADYQERRRQPGFRLSFGPPEFDAAVHAIADRLAAEPAFQAPDTPARRPGGLITVLYAGNGPTPPRDPLASPRHVRALRADLCAAAWPDLREALRLWRPVCEDHIAPISLFAHPVLAQLITRERGREILSLPRA
jgi:hypothetical protein